MSSESDVHRETKGLWNPLSHCVDFYWYYHVSHVNNLHKIAAFLQPETNQALGIGKKITAPIFYFKRAMMKFNRIHGEAAIRMMLTKEASTVLF